MTEDDLGDVSRCVAMAKDISMDAAEEEHKNVTEGCSMFRTCHCFTPDWLKQELINITVLSGQLLGLWACSASFFPTPLRTLSMDSWKTNDPIRRLYWFRQPHCFFFTASKIPALFWPLRMFQIHRKHALKYLPGSKQPIGVEAVSANSTSKPDPNCILANSSCK